MAGLQAYLRPVLVLMTTLEAAMMDVGAILWYQTKVSLQGVYTGLQSRAAGAYQDVRRRASYVYEDIQVKAGDKYQVVQNHTSETCQQWMNRVNLVYIECQLRLSLAFHNFQFQWSLWFKGFKSHLSQKLYLLVGVHLEDAQRKVTLMHKWTRIKVTRIKKAAAESAKVTLEHMSLKAREYEDVLDEKLSKLSRSPSTKRHLLQRPQPVVPPRKREKDRGDDDHSRSSSNASSVRGSKSSLEVKEEQQQQQ